MNLHMQNLQQIFESENMDSEQCWTLGNQLLYQPDQYAVRFCLFKPEKIAVAQVVTYITILMYYY